jgi:hypothetical protein
MKKYILLLLYTTVVFISCNYKRKVIRDDLIGVFEHISKYGSWKQVRNVIEFNKDDSFTHWIYRGDNLLLKETGRWEYYPDTITILKQTDLTLYNFTTYIDYYSEDMVYGERDKGIKAIKTLLGKVYLRVTIPYDPDGAPICPKYKK